MKTPKFKRTFRAIRLDIFLTTDLTGKTTISTELKHKCKDGADAWNLVEQVVTHKLHEKG